MISEIIYSSHKIGGKIIVSGILGDREYPGLTKLEAEIKYIEECNKKVFVSM